MPLSSLERKAQMVLKQVQQIALAEQLGVTQSHISQVLSGDRRSPRVEQAIADAFGMPVEEVFPPANAGDSEAA
jgi:transcriptional regulator with XRE-family HTH domain